MACTPRRSPSRPVGGHTSCRWGLAVAGFSVCAALASSGSPEAHVRVPGDARSMFAVPPAQSSVSLVVARGAWLRECAVGRTSTAAYVTFDNPAPLPVSVTGVEVEGAGTAEFHDVQPDGDRTAMRRVLAFSIPARGQMVLKPGGLHIVLSGLTRAYEPGDRPLVTFRFDDGTFLMVRAEVRQAPDAEEARAGAAGLTPRGLTG